MKNRKQYYKELGKLVCAVAKADGAIQIEEVNALKQFVEKQLALEEYQSDSSGMNKAFYVDFEFEEEVLRTSDQSNLIKNFSSFVHRNFEPGDEKLIDQSMKLVETVADAFKEGDERKIIEWVKSELIEVIHQK